MEHQLDSLDVDYSAGEGESPSDYPNVEQKLLKGTEIVEEALDEYDNPAIMWTGGKDSTLVLYLVKSVVDEQGGEMPPVVFIDHFQHFPEIISFSKHWANEWDLDLIFARNDDVGNIASEPGEDVRVDDLNKENQYEVREKLEYEDETFPFLLDTYVGNHLLKTVALNDTLEEHDIDGIFSGVRWDEQESRAKETFFSPRHDSEKYPPHDRIQPILQFDERAVWEATWEYLVPDIVDQFPDSGMYPSGLSDLPNDLAPGDVPVSPKYFTGFRSLGSEVSTDKTTNEPAWMQNLEETTERAGRAQDKEDLMGRLRDLGYM